MLKGISPRFYTLNKPETKYSYISIYFEIIVFINYSE